ncbi:unnamed protein product [Brassicogethes aeneus]|uniref:Lysosome-associated membrane glycoprotein 2-like luminal domain-containing protein n=1 Tax=Brassicogethes aeneus TaxID=1431903 RepID=A0A9P0FAV5_BRAAE|nr:unnamed protein product [Brassicogethes aeneus]
MAKIGGVVYLKLFIICATTSSLVDSLTLPNLATSKPRHTKFSSSTTEPGSGSLVTPTSSTASKDQSGVALYRNIDSNSQATCILLKTDALVEVKFKLHNLEEQADSFIPEKVLVDGNCKYEDAQLLRIIWTGYNLEINFAKTPGGEMWYISNIELTVSPDLPQFHGIQTRGKPIKLYHRKMEIATPVGRSFKCDEVDIDLVTEESDHPPPGLRGTLLLRLLQVQPFMYKSENFGPTFECRGQKQFRDETAPIAVGSTLAIAVLMTVTGYGAFRYFKVKNVQYNTME